MSSRLNLLCLIVAASVGMAACGGGGGGGGEPAPAPPPPAPSPPPPPPPPSSFSLSGTISIAPTAAVDSDSNDVSQADQGKYRVNDTIGTAQVIGSPVLLVGTVNETRTGPTGNNFEPGDRDDYFRVDLVAGQVVELEFAAEPAESDVDLYLVSADGQFGGESLGEDTRYECVQATTSGSYYINVYAFSNSSIYNLRIGAPGSTGACANSTSAAAAAPGQLLAKARAVDGKRAKQLDTRLQAAGVRGASFMATTTTAAAAGKAGVPTLLQLPAAGAARAEGLATLRGGASPASAQKRLAAAAGPANAAAAAGAGHDRIELLKYAKHLRATGGFEYVQPNWISQRFATVGEFPPSDRNYSYQRWHYEQINLPAAMSRITALTTQPSQRPLVAVIDDGVVLDHPDLAPQLFSNGRSFITRTNAGDGNSNTGDNPSVKADQPVFHGTHVSGTVGAATYDGVGGAGTAPMALILPLRVFPPQSGATQLDVINAMLYAARLTNNSGTLPSRRADVINLSLGADRPCDAAYQDAVTQVRAAGVIVVAAAGNSGRNNIGQRAAVGSPANCTGAVAVSALDARKQVTPYSNTGAQIAVAAPGGDTSQSTTGNGSPDAVYSDVATFDANGTRLPAFGGMQGTSMASPHVAGVMALMRYVNPALTVAQVDALLANGDLTEDLGAAGRDIDFGFGLIDARKAVNAALAAAGTPAPAPAGRVVASPSSIDFGSFQSQGVLELVASAATTETVVSISSDSAAVTVAPTTVDTTTRLGRYTVSVNRAALAAGSYFPKLTVTLAPARSLTVQLSITVPGAAGNTTNADYGPMYVLLFNPDTQAVVASVLATHSGGRYNWSYTGYELPRVAIAAGGDLDNDNLVCQRGEPCGAYPVLAPGRDLSVITLTADRNDLDFEAAPLSGISAQRVGAGSRTGWRKGAVLRGVPTPAKQ